ncbi:hypothetical protein E8F11_06275 [Pseudomonas sp. BN417]|uniref:hypothetical protein n=1 Tax=Pseudomonas sp. BN417 TaxID=2567890 RepID=UPI0024574F65|nr:hypothetical protein [Pseudomonas sp. BN417]MDH4554785.1 hypothetical protein [Pseudomonas sp. BN417]
MTNVAFNSATPSLATPPAATHALATPKRKPQLRLIVDNTQSDDGVSKATSDGRYLVQRDGSKVLIIDTLTGELKRTLRPQNDDREVTETQLSDPVAQALLDGSLKAKPTRAKRKVINPHGRELMAYKLSNQERFFMLLKAVVVTDSTLIAKSGKLNFNFRDLGRILCMDEFSSGHLFSDSRGNEYTMAAYRKVIGRFVKVCRQAWEGKALSPDYDQIP